MKKKIIITSIFLLLLLPVAIAFADSGFLVGGGDQVEAGKQLGFKIDLEKITEDEYGPYVIAVDISPSEPQLWLDVKENVKVDVNKVNGEYTLKSEDLVNLKSLNVIMSPDSGLEEATTYTVSVNIVGTKKTDEEEFSFDAVPLSENTDNNNNNDNDNGTGGGSGGGGSSGGNVDPKYVYHGSADNYLNSLSVQGHKLNETFDKTRAVYFVNVDKSVSKISINAVPSYRKTRVDIVGNNDVSAEMSKVTISLRAENGNVRVYRIYVRHQEAK